jgi:hypothetical protein
MVISIIKHDLHFSYVKYEGVRNTHQYLRGDVPFISKTTVKADLREKQVIKSMLSVCLGRICLWTSLTNDGYICLTVHSISKDWVLAKRVLNFSFMPPPHNGNSLSNMILSLLQKWGIDKNIFTITRTMLLLMIVVLSC